MTIDLWLRDQSGRPIAKVADNPDLPQVPPRVCPHSPLAICQECRA